MAQGDVQITVIGNLVADPEIKYTNNGKAVANFRVVSSTRKLENGKWVDGEATYLTCNAWDDLAEHVGASLHKGLRVIVQGVLKQRSYETKDGAKRTVFEVRTDEVGPSLRFATAQVTRAQRGNSFAGGNQDPWNNAPAQSQFPAPESTPF